MLGQVDTPQRKQMVSTALPVTRTRIILKTHNTIEGSTSSQALALAVATTSRTTTINSSSSIATIVAVAS